MSAFKRFLILAAAAALILGVIPLFTYDLIKIDWISFMEIQQSYRPMEEPLPVPEQSIPIEGAAYIPGMGAPANPVEADEISLERGRLLFEVNCVLCHGAGGKGDGMISAFLQNKPADLTSDSVRSASDGAIFMVITSGSPGKMPALNENLTVRDRWDVVNYVRTLKP